MGEIEYLCDGKDFLTVQELSDRYSHDLPLLVVVVQGFFANREDMCFSTGQVLRLQELRHQMRALVHDKQKNTLSLPLDYSHSFYVGEDATRAMTVGEILDLHHNKLPVMVRFADSNMRFDCGPDYGMRNLSTLKIIKQYEETYFIANCVMQGQLLETSISIPMYLKNVRFSIVTGIKGRGITDGGRGLMHALLHSQAQNFDFTCNQGDPAMVQLSEEPIRATDNIYQNIKTNIYITVHAQRRRPPPPPPEQEEEQQQQRRRIEKPPPPRPVKDAVSSNTSAHKAEDKPQKNQGFKNLRKLSAADASSEYTSAMSAAAWSGNGAVDHARIARTDDVYEQIPDESGVYEPVVTNPTQKRGSLYTSLQLTTPPSVPPAESPVDLSELHYVLEKRNTRKSVGHQDEGKKQGSTQHHSLEIKDRSPSTHQPESQGGQIPWRAGLRPVQSKLSMSSQSDSTALSGERVSEASPPQSSASTTKAAKTAATAQTPATTGKEETVKKPPVSSEKPAEPKKPVLGPKTTLAVKSQPEPHSEPGAQKESTFPAQKGSTLPGTLKGTGSAFPAQKGSTLPGALKGTGSAFPAQTTSTHPPSQKTEAHAKAAAAATRPEQQKKNPLHDAAQSPVQHQQPLPPAPPVTDRHHASQTTPARAPVSGAGPSFEVPTDNSARIATYINQQEMAVITPTLSPSSETGGEDRVSSSRRPSAELMKKTLEHGSQGHGQGRVPVVTGSGGDARKGVMPRADQQSSALLPLDLPLDCWTIRDVQQLLTRLNLQCHGDDFRKQQIDGKLLQQLMETTSVLEKELGMSRVGILKLQNFVSTRHLPE